MLYYRRDAVLWCSGESNLTHSPAIHLLGKTRYIGRRRNKEKPMGTIEITLKAQPPLITQIEGTIRHFLTQTKTHNWFLAVLPHIAMDDAAQPRNTSLHRYTQTTLIVLYEADALPPAELLEETYATLGITDLSLSTPLPTDEFEEIYTPLHHTSVEQTLWVQPDPTRPDYERWELTQERLTNRCPITLEPPTGEPETHTHHTIITRLEELLPHPHQETDLQDFLAVWLTSTAKTRKQVVALYIDPKATTARKNAIETACDYQLIAIEALLTTADNKDVERQHLEALPHEYITTLAKSVFNPTE